MNEMSKTCKTENNSNMNSQQNSKQEIETGNKKKDLPGRRSPTSGLAAAQRSAQAITNTAQLLA
jgi:hypothetical protein